MVMHREIKRRIDMSKALLDLLTNEMKIVSYIKSMKETLEMLPLGDIYDFVILDLKESIHREEEELLLVRKEIKEYFSYIESL